MRLGQAKTPENMRIYAIGDVHGCDDLLAEVHARIGKDLAGRPAAEHRIVHVGDYIDRGPNSAAVVQRLARMNADDPNAIFLRGNHDELMLGFLTDPVGFGPTWLMNGGSRTLFDYGVSVAGRDVSRRDLVALGEALSARLPLAHRYFLETLAYTARLGDFFFCHAGIRPGIALEKQSHEDLVWIREEFLLDPRDHGVVVIHGHTPAAEPEVLPNRINIDTGAVFTGQLTCLVLEGSEYRFL